MEENEKIIEFLISPEFYNDWFLFVAEAFNIKSTEDNDFFKFVSILQFLDGWVRGNWSNEESQVKAKEIMQPVGFSEEEINKILDFINQNFALKREELWREASKTPETIDDFGEKEKRYIEFMKTLVKYHEVTKPYTEVPTSLQESFAPSENENTLSPQEELFLKSDKEEKIEDIQPKIEDETKLKPAEADIATINLEPLKQTTLKNSIESLDNIVISKKKEEEKKSEEDEKFLDLSNL